MPDRAEPLPASPDVLRLAFRRRTVVASLLGVIFLGVSLLWVILLAAVVRDAFLARLRTEEDQKITSSEASLSVAFSPDGNLIVLGSRASRLEVGAVWGHVKVWDGQTGKEQLSFKVPAGWVFSMAFSPDGKRMVSGSRSYNVKTRQVWGEVKVWDAHTGEEQLTLQGHTEAVSSVAFSPDGRRIASGSDDNTVKVWDAHTGQEIRTINGHTASVWSVAFSADGKRLASGSTDRTVKVWDAQTGQETLTLKGHTDYVLSVAFSADGKRIASGSYDHTVRVWEAQTGREALTLKGHTDKVQRVAFFPDGERIASGSWDNTVRVWDAHTGQELRTLRLAAD